MEIIRDEETFGLMMIPLFVDWGVWRCNVKDCTHKPSTIIVYKAGEVTPEPLIIGMREEHFQAANQGEPVTYNFEWNDFDAFKKGDANGNQA